MTGKANRVPSNIDILRKIGITERKIYGLLRRNNAVSGIGATGGNFLQNGISNINQFTPTDPTGSLFQLGDYTGFRYEQKNEITLTSGSTPVSFASELSFSDPTGHVQEYMYAAWRLDFPKMAAGGTGNIAGLTMHQYGQYDTTLAGSGVTTGIYTQGNPSQINNDFALAYAGSSSYLNNERHGSAFIPLNPANDDHAYIILYHLNVIGETVLAKNIKFTLYLWLFPETTITKLI